MTNDKIYQTLLYPMFIKTINALLFLILTLSTTLTSASTGVKNYSGSQQTALGQAFINHLHLRYDIVQDPEINHYIRSIGKRIVQHTNSTKRFRFYVINNPDINAFAGPDGTIGIHTGLIHSVASEDELASVMAHEIAHVTQEHLYRRMELQSKSTLPQIASMIAAILIGIHDTDAGIATLMGSTAYQIEKQLKYSRLHEYEADFAGINFLSLSGYDPHAMPDFFEKLANSYQHQGMSAPEILRTHPLTENRLAKAQARAESLANSTKIKDNTNLNLIQVRLESLFPSSSKLSYKKNKNETVSCYQNALAQLSKIDDKIDIPICLQDFIKSNSQQYLFHALNLELLAKGNTQHSKETIARESLLSYELFPLNESVVLRYTELLGSQNKTLQAIMELERFSETTEYKNRTETALGRLYLKIGITAQSYYHLALAQLDIGNVQRAAIYTEKAKSSVQPTDKVLNEKVLQLQEKLSKLLKSNLDS